MLSLSREGQFSAPPRLRASARTIFFASFEVLAPLLERLFSADALPVATAASAALGRTDGAERLAELVVEALAPAAR